MASCHWRLKRKLALACDGRWMWAMVNLTHAEVNFFLAHLKVDVVGVRSGSSVSFILY